MDACNITAGPRNIEPLKTKFHSGDAQIGIGRMHLRQYDSDLLTLVAQSLI